LGRFPKYFGENSSIEPCWACFLKPFSGEVPYNSARENDMFLNVPPMLSRKVLNISPEKFKKK